MSDEAVQSPKITAKSRDYEQRSTVHCTVVHCSYFEVCTCVATVHVVWVTVSVQTDNSTEMIYSCTYCTYCTCMYCAYCTS